ncbi:hypothetical protein A2U01_0087762, partial [Trifolium medium]|nr:hypothetical protein [Trifolium medium]
IRGWSMAEVSVPPCDSGGVILRSAMSVSMALVAVPPCQRVRFCLKEGYYGNVYENKGIAEI